MLRPQFYNQNNLDGLYRQWTWLPSGPTLEDVKQFLGSSNAALPDANIEAAYSEIFLFSTWEIYAVKATISYRWRQAVKSILEAVATVISSEYSSCKKLSYYVPARMDINYEDEKNIVQQYIDINTRK